MDNRSNALARYKLLRKALQGAKQIPASLLKACTSQGGLAKLDLPSEGVTPMSLNTLKSKADEVIEEGGWNRLDEMRRSYLEVGKTSAARPFSTRRRAGDLKMKLEQVEKALETERRYRIRLQVAYEALLDRMRSTSKRRV